LAQRLVLDEAGRTFRMEQGNCTKVVSEAACSWTNVDGHAKRMPSTVSVVGTPF
jgi:hypothetical protein